MTQKTWEAAMQRLEAARAAIAAQRYHVETVPRWKTTAAVANGDNRQYQVRYDPQTHLLTCTCPDYTARGGLCCKHTFMALLVNWPERLVDHLLVLEARITAATTLPAPPATGPAWAQAAALAAQWQVAADDAEEDAAYPADAPDAETAEEPPPYPTHWEQLATGKFKWCRLPMVTLERLLAFSIADSLTQILTARLGVTAPVAQEVGDLLLTKVVQSLRHQIWLEERARYNNPESYC